MKKYSILFASLLIPSLLFSQTKLESKPADPFCQMIKTIFSLDALRFNSQFNMKQVFENDTVTSYAQVIVKKTGTDISFLQIIPVTADEELLYCGDSAWIVNHEQQKMDCIGTRLEHLAYNGMSSFFSFTLFSVDTLISRVEPYWKIIDKSSGFTVVSIDIRQSSKDVTDIRAEFTIGNNDFLPYNTLQESTYMNADKIFQEQLFSDYTFPDPGEIKIPDYYLVYSKDFSIIKQNENLAQSDPEEQFEDILLQEVNLFSLSGQPADLPGNGLIFIDLWYVGCAPCMKSAPVMEKIHNRYSDDLYFISVNETDHDTLKIRRFKEKMGISFPVLLGKKGDLARKVTGQNAYPVFILMDAGSKKVLWTFTGYSENLKELIVKAIDDHL